MNKEEAIALIEYYERTRKTDIVPQPSPTQISREEGGEPSAAAIRQASKINSVLIERHHILRDEALLNDVRNIIGYYLDEFAPDTSASTPAPSGERVRKLLTDYAEIIADIRERVASKERVDWVDCKNLLRIIDALAAPKPTPEESEG